MARLIDADEVRKKAVPHTRGNYGYSADIRKWAVLVGDIDNASTIDPENLRPKGKWERRMEQDSRIYTDMAWCSNCGYHMIFKRQFAQKLSNCGADMRGEDDGND